MRFIQSILYGSLVFALVGCSSGKSTSVRITGASRDRVANALWEAGAKIESPYGGEELIWSSVDKINKRKAVIIPLPIVNTKTWGF